MPTEFQRKAEELFQEALKRPPSERAAFLTDACAQDDALQGEVASLLAHHEQAADFLEQPISTSAVNAFAADVSGSEPADAHTSPKGSPPDRAVPVDAGRRVGSYRLIRKLGEGGIGVVYLAEQDRPRRKVALKIIRPLAVSADMRRRFEKEAEVLGRLRHPGIAQVFEAGTTDADQGRLPFFAMELVEGLPLTDYADARRLNTSERLHLLARVCHAVEHAHQRGVIHRDLKPANVLVVDQEATKAEARANHDVPRPDRPAESHASDAGGIHDNHDGAGPREDRGLTPTSLRGSVPWWLRGLSTTRLRSPVAPWLASAQPKILDFGIARVTDADVSATTMRTDPGQIIGTVAYMSPEQALGDSSRLDTRSDVYALGVICYELLTGRLPYEIEDRMIHEALRVICEEEPARLGTVSRAFRGDLETIVAKALEKDKERRYPSAAALAGDIERYITNQPIIARPPSTAYQLRKFAGRHRGLVISAGIAAVTLIVATAGMTWQALRATQQSRRARDAELLALERRAQAEEARDAFEAVARVLEQMLVSADPEELGRDVLVRDVLPEASRIIEHQLSAKPFIEARLRAAIGKTYHSLGDLDTAELNLVRSLELNRRRGGDTDAETLSSMNRLAELYADQGRVDEAESLHRQVLDVRRRVLGEEHLDTLTSMNNLGALLRARGRLDEAEPLLRRTLDARRRILGLRHPDTLVPANNLAMLLKDHGRAAEAELLLRQVQEGRQEMLGHEHPRTLMATDNLAGVLNDLGRLADAEQLYRRAFEGRRKVLGDGHPDTLNSMSNLGDLLRARGDLAESETLLRGALDGRRRVLGLHHPRTLISINNLALLLRSKGQYADAEPLLRECLRLHREQDGEGHRSTLWAMNNLASVLWKQGNESEAEALCREGLRIRRKVFGHDHPATLNAINSLATILQETGAHTEAETLYAEAVRRAESVLPPGHHQTAQFQSNYGQCLMQLEHYQEAEQHLLEGYQTLVASLGNDHPQTKAAQRRVVQFYESQNKPDVAATWRAVQNEPASVAIPTETPPPQKHVDDAL